MNKYTKQAITSEAEAEEVTALIDGLLDKGLLNEVEEEYLNDLGNLLHPYEREHVVIPDIYGTELLQSLMEDNHLISKDLSHVLGSVSYVESILSGSKELTDSDISKLSAYFHVSESCFYPINE